MGGPSRTDGAKEDVADTLPAFTALDVHDLDQIIESMVRQRKRVHDASPDRHGVHFCTEPPDLVNLRDLRDRVQQHVSRHEKGDSDA